LIFAPAALALLSAITDDCVPVAVRLFLIFGRDLKREGFVMFEHRTAVEAETGYAEDREFNRQHVALFSAGIVAGRMVHSTDSTVGEGCSIEAGSSLGVLVVPQANGVLGHCLAFSVWTRPTPQRIVGNSVPVESCNSIADYFRSAECPLLGVKRTSHGN